MPLGTFSTVRWIEEYTTKGRPRLPPCGGTISAETVTAVNNKSSNTKQVILRFDIVELLFLKIINAAITATVAQSAAPVIQYGFRIEIG
jgi:hypothetical protein